MTEERIIAYLLEELPEEESGRFEDECFAEENWPDQIHLTEEDLIDAYLRDELTPERRQRFDQNYLTTEARKERVMVASALLRHVDEQQPVAQATAAAQPTEPTWNERLRDFWSKQNWALRTAAAMIVLAIVVGAWWFSRPRTPSQQTFATLTLNISSSSRSQDAQVGEVKLSPEISALRISLILPERLPSIPRYRVELVNNDGEVKPVETAGQDAQSVLVVIPAEQLARGQYALRLFAIKTDGTEQRIPGNYFLIVR